MTSTLKTRPWDPAERRETEEDIAAHLQAAFEEGDPSLVAAALATSPAQKAWHKSPAHRARAREPLQSIVLGSQPRVRYSRRCELKLNIFKYTINRRNCHPNYCRISLTIWTIDPFDCSVTCAL